eukprot:gene1859-24457_t
MSGNDVYMDVTDPSAPGAEAQIPQPQPGEPGSWWAKEENDQNMLGEPWYFGKIPRTEAQLILSTKPRNSFVVRVSDKHTGYAITVSYEQDGSVRYSHIMIMMNDNPTGGRSLWLVSDKQFHSIAEVIRFYQKNSYKGLFTLGNPARQPATTGAAAAAGGGGGGPPPVPNRTLPKGAKMTPIPTESYDAYASIEEESPYSSIEDPNHGSYIYSIAGDEVKSLAGAAAEKGKVLLDNDGDEDEDAYCIPGVLRASAETVDFASDDIYMDIGPAATEIKRQATMKVKRSKDPKDWGAAEVLQFLGDNGLDAFKPVLYRNGVIGKTLLKLRSSMFPQGKFTEEEMQQFDQELIRLRLSGM